MSERCTENSGSPQKGQGNPTLLSGAPWKVVMLHRKVILKFCAQSAAPLILLVHMLVGMTAKRVDPTRSMNLWRGVSPPFQSFSNQSKMKTKGSKTPLKVKPWCASFWLSAAYHFLQQTSLPRPWNRSDISWSENHKRYATILKFCLSVCLYVYSFICTHPTSLPDLQSLQSISSPFQNQQI